MKNIIKNLPAWLKGTGFFWVLIGIGVLVVVWAIDLIVEAFDIFDAAEELKPTKVDQDRWMELFMKLHDPSATGGFFGGLTEAEALEWDALIKAQVEYSRAITGGWPRMLAGPVLFFGGLFLSLFGIAGGVCKVVEVREKEGEGTTWTL